VRAEKATFTEKEARLFGFLATPCPCGEDLRLSLEEATFLVDTGELRGEASLGLFGLEVPLSEARVNLNRPPRLESPLVFSASDTGGYTLGLRDFPLPRPGEEVGAWKRRLTLLASGLTTSKESLLFGLKEGSLGAEVRLGYGAGVRAFWDDLLFAATPLPPDATTPRLEARYTPRFLLEGAELKPFVRYAETANAQGWILGLEGRYPWGFREGPFSLSLEPGLLLALYPGRNPYLSLWGSLRAAFREGKARAEVGYWAGWSPSAPGTSSPTRPGPRGSAWTSSWPMGRWRGGTTWKTPWETGWWGWRWPTGTGPWAASGWAGGRGATRSGFSPTPCPSPTAPAARPCGWRPRWAWASRG